MVLNFEEFQELVQLIESARSTAVLSFGRFNPVTTGHRKMMNKLVELGRKNGAVPMLFLSHSHDRKKNPLSYADKLKFCKNAAPRGLKVVKSEAKNIVDVLKVATSLGANHLILVVGSDRVQDFKRFTKYLDEIGAKSLEVVSAGERDPDADDVTGMSASKLRALAANDDWEGFKAGAGTRDEKATREMYEKVRAGMGLTS